MSLAAFLAALGGFAALALAMGRRHQTLLARAPSRRGAMALRLTGWLLLGASLTASLRWLGSPVGFVVWIGILNAAALLTALSLTAAARLRGK